MADDGGDDVDVVVSVADGCPTAGDIVAFRGDAGGGDHAAGDVRPLLIGEDRVFGGGAYGQVPDVLGGPGAFGQGHDGLVEQALQLAVCRLGVASGVGGQAIPCRDEVGVDVLLGLAGAVQVGHQAAGVRAHVVDFGDHAAGRPPSR